MLARYHSLGPTGRAAFFDALAEEFSPDAVALEHAAKGYVKNPSDEGLLELKRAGESPRQDVFVRINALPGGTALLVAMRAHLLQGLNDHRAWSSVEADLLHVLRSVFNCTFLDFRRIDRDTPAPVIEKLMHYEAVHAIHSWREMQRRLAADRRCYAFFHPAWPDEPVIFTELALTCGVSSRVQPILDPGSSLLEPAVCDTAIFYSITNCHAGLRGLSFGNALIGRVVADLRAQLPRLRTFATLSPIPGFRSWLMALIGSLGNASSAALLAKMNALGRSDAADVSARLEHELLPLCAYYLLHAKHGDEPADPVARFHLANGACLRRINWLGDVSPAGIERSVGLTANYVYRPAAVERNRAMYASDHTINTTRTVERLSRAGADLCGRATSVRTSPGSAAL